MKHPIRRRLLYALFRTAQALAAVLPFRVTQAAGTLVGNAAYAILPAQRRLIGAHLDFAFGNGALTVNRKRRIAREVFVNLGRSGLEWLAIPKLTLEDLRHLIDVEGLEHLREASSRGRGVLACSAHFGNWELIALCLRSHGFEGGILARRLRYPEYEDFFTDMRAGKGLATYERGSVRDVARVLRANKIIGLMPDQDTEGLDGVFIDFFDHPAYTPIGHAALSLMTGAPIVPCFILRRGGGFQLMIEAPLYPENFAGNRKEAATALTQAFSRVAESYIRRYPGHWVWMHKRWKTKPQSEVSAAGRSSDGTDKSESGGSAFPKLGLALAIVLLAQAGCRVGGADAKKAAAAKAEPIPQQQLDGFTLTGYDNDGRKRWDLDGTEATMEDQIVTIQSPKGVGYDVERTAHLTAKEAHVNQVTRVVNLNQDVVIHTSDGVWFSTSTLNWVPDVERAYTDAPVKIETDHMLLRGRGFEGMTHLKHARILTDVEVILNPTGDDTQRPYSVPKHVKITCKGPLDLQYDKKLVIFNEDVHVMDANGELFADLLVAHLNADGKTIRFAEATGNVRIVQEGHHANSERAIYEPSKGKISLVGKPTLLLMPDAGGKGFSMTNLTAPKPASKADGQSR